MILFKNKRTKKQLFFVIVESIEIITEGKSIKNILVEQQNFILDRPDI